MPTLQLLIFKSCPIAPKIAHWALFLPQYDGSPFGILYSVKKTGFVSRNTQLSLLNLNPQDEYESDIQSMIAIPELDVQPYNVAMICRQVSEGRHFNLITQNCQHFICEVLNELLQLHNEGERDTVMRRIRNLGWYL